MAPELPEASPNEDGFELSQIPWAIPGRTFGKLYFLWYTGGPPKCQRKQATAKILKTCMLEGTGIAAARETGQDICANCKAKLKL